MDEEYLKRLLFSVARGVPQMATGFVDLASLPFTMTGLLEPEQAVGSTAYLTSKGLLPPPQEGLLSETSEMLASAISPAGAAKTGLLGLGAIAGARGAKGANKAIKTAQDEAMEVAQRNAALPVEQGGLGLPVDNTAMDRAKALGFDTDRVLYHGTDQNIKAFDPKMFGKKDQGWYGRGVTMDTDPEIAAAYANYNENIKDQVIYPLMTRGKYLEWPKGQPPFATRKDSIKGTEDIKNLGYSGTRMTNDRNLFNEIPEIGTEQVVFDPKNVRSRFAAFDPMRKNEPDLLASILAGLGLGGLLSLEEEEQF
jgi:hypothetical protein